MPRIHGLPIPALFPDSGPVSVMLFGEAPGPRGADQSGIPFWGDRAGVSVYRALEAAASPATTTREQAWPWPRAYFSVGYICAVVSAMATSTSPPWPQRRTISSRGGSARSMSRAREARAKA